MPGMNQMGPMNQGPMTGRGQGVCQGRGQGRQGAGFGQGFGQQNYGQGMGRGFGRGRRGCRGFGYGPGQGFQAAPAGPTLEEQAQFLEDELAAVREQLKAQSKPTE